MNMKKLLSALLALLVLLSGVALMEDEIPEDAVEVPEAIAVEEVSVDVAADDDVSAAAVDDVVAEEVSDLGEGIVVEAEDVVNDEAQMDSLTSADFPDSEFWNYLVTRYDEDGDGTLSSSEVAAITNLQVYISDITSLEGVKKLTALTYLECTGIPLTSLDLSGCTNLLKVHVWDNKLTTLNVDGCANLKDLECSGNQLTTLNISGCPNLSDLYCGTNQLTSLNVSSCTNLETLYCETNQLTSIDVSIFPNLRELKCSDNKLTVLKFGSNSALLSLQCGTNPLTSLDLSSCPNLKLLYCDADQLTTLDVSKLADLENLDCRNNKLTSLDVTHNTLLYMVWCEGNNITTLDLSNCSLLLDNISKANRAVSSDGKTVSYTLPSDYPSEYDTVLSFDASVNVILTKATVTATTKPVVTPAPTATPAPVVTPAPTATPAPAVTAAPTPEPGSSASNPLTIVSTKTSTKAKAYVGKYYQIDLYGKNGSGFKSSNKKIATVSKTGLVTPKKAGKVKITFKVGKKKRTITLTVADPTIPTKVYLNLKGTVAAKVGVPQTLTATLNPGAVSGLKWTTSNKKIATVKNGVVTFKKNGTVTITVTTVKGNKKAKVKFKVTK